MNKKLRRKILAITIVLSIPVSTCMALPLDEAQQVQKVVDSSEKISDYYRQQQLLQNVPAPRQKAVVVEKEKTAPPASGTQAVFTVKKIEFSASEILTAKELATIAGNYEGKKLSLADLNAMLKKINDLYAAKQVITAKAILPPQKIVNGVVRIKLIEGRYGSFTIKGNKHTNKEYILNRIFLKKGQLVRLDELEQKLTYFNRTNDVSVKAELVPGREVGATDCILHVQEPANRETLLFADNAGSKDSGLYRIGALIVYNSLNGGRENLTINPTWTEGTLAGSISYSQPMDNRGSKIGFSYSKNALDIIDGDLASMDVVGNSENYGLTFSRPLKVTSQLKTEAFANVYHKFSETDFFGNNLLHTVLNTYTVGYTLQQDLKGGLWYGMISGTHIRGSQKAEPTNASFARGNLTLIRQQVFGGKQIFTFRSSGQYSTSKELPSSEQFSLGGISTVKGFTESIISGEKGYYFGIEYSMLMDKAINGRVFVGVDHGAVYQAFNDSPSQRDYLTSASIGYSLNIGREAFAKVVVGVPLANSKSVSHDKARVHFYMQRKL